MGVPDDQRFETVRHSWMIAEVREPTHRSFPYALRRRDQIPEHPESPCEPAVPCASRSASAVARQAGLVGDDDELGAIAGA
ncbi:hypothetical protein GCM10010330_44600 [Streptomyces tendae]|nr:hypothetical protein GCM10010330_44600 [Streptomyces tendae]